MNDKLTPQEEYFCELYAHGDAPYTGNASKCYREAFGIPDDKKTVHLKAMQTMRRKDIQARIDELQGLNDTDQKDMKQFLASNLKHIVEECTTATFRDRRGTQLSPAPLRSVAVNAAKALMELYPVKEAQEHKLSIDGAGEGGITFNVIMPEKKAENQKESE